MAIQINWLDDEQKCIHFRAEGGWTWRDYNDVMAEAYKMMDASPHEEIDFILDLTRSTLFPQDMLTKMKRNEKHPKSHKMVVVGAGSFAETLFRLMESLAPEKMQFIKLCKTVDEANAFLDKV